MLNISYAEPAQALSGLVRAYHLYEADLSGNMMVHDRLLSELATIVVPISGRWSTTGDAAIFNGPKQALVAGPSNRPMRFSAQGEVRVFGISLTPLGWAKLFDQPASMVANRICDLVQLIGSRATLLVDRVHRADCLATMARYADELLLSVLNFRQETYLTRTVTAMDHNLRTHPITKVADLSALMGISMRQVERVMPMAYGFAPKMVLRRLRYLRAIEEVMGTVSHELTDCLADDFYDQSHMIREFTQFSGESPKRFFSRGIQLGHWPSKSNPVKRSLLKAPLIAASLFLEAMPAMPMLRIAA